MKYQVFDNDKPAETRFLSGAIVCRFPPGIWHRSVFDTFEEAQKYANDWLGCYGPINLNLNERVNYSGYGDYIEIREIES